LGAYMGSQRIVRAIAQDPFDRSEVSSSMFKEVPVSSRLDSFVD
jgi:hypothetical protein